jgi:tetratricopeptide (TPR) repeat protein
MLVDGGRYSWPSQLEKILNERNTGVRFKVINKGVESANSTFILSYLKENLDKYNPDMVITMMGENDGSETIPYIDSWSVKIKLFLRDFRVYKLSKLIRLHILNKVREIKEANNQNLEYEKINNVYKNDESISDSLEGFKDPVVRGLFHKFMIYKNQRNFEEPDENLEKAEEIIKKAIAIAIEPDRTVLYIHLADCYTIHEKHKEAEEVLKKVIERNPKDIFALVTLGCCYKSQLKYPESEEVFKKAIEIDPEYDQPYYELAISYREQGKYKELQDLSEKIIKAGLKGGVFDGFVAISYIEQKKYKEAERYYKKANELRLRYYNEGTRYNYNKLRDIVNQRGIKLVCIQHPMRKSEPLKKIFDVTEGIIFVDNEKIFKDAVKNEKYEDYFKDNFAGDFGHCTPRGDRLLAENIANVIIKEVFKK